MKCCFFSKDTIVNLKSYWSFFTNQLRIPQSIRNLIEISTFQFIFPTSIFISKLIWIIPTDLKAFELFNISNITFQSIWKPGKRDYEFRKKYPESKLDLMRTQPMRTLWGIMRELEHTDRIIDVVKIDREGPRKAYEPAVIRNLLEDGTYRYIEFYLNV